MSLFRRYISRGDADAQIRQARAQIDGVLARIDADDKSIAVLLEPHTGHPLVLAALPARIDMEAARARLADVHVELDAIYQGFDDGTRGLDKIFKDSDGYELVEKTVDAIKDVAARVQQALGDYQRARGRLAEAIGAVAGP
jgi:hypothetical protein